MRTWILPGICALTIFSGCYKHQKVNEYIEPTGEVMDRTVSIHARQPATKTYIAEVRESAYAIFWNNGDRLTFYIDSWENATQMTNQSEDGEPALFESIVKDVPDGSHVAYAAFPQSAISQTLEGPKIRMTIPEVQKPTLESFDPAADRGVGRAEILVKTQSPEVTISDMHFTRLACTIIVSFITTDCAIDLSAEKVQRFTMETGAEGTAFTGTVEVFFPAPDEWDYKTTEPEKVTVTTVTPNRKITADLSANPMPIGEEYFTFLLVAPGVLPKGSSLTVTIETDHYHIVKSIPSLPGKMEFVPNKLGTLKLAIRDSDCTFTPHNE